MAGGPTPGDPGSAREALGSARVRGREHERDLVRGLIDQARNGRAAVLGLRGEAGSGKTTLCEAAVSLAGDATVVALRACEAESDLSLAALFAFLRPLRPLVDDLPVAQRDVARALLDGVVGPAHTDRLALGAVTLALLSSAAEAGPVLVVVDDAHWVDPLSGAVLAFAFRRLDRESVAVLVCGRPVEPDPLPGDWPRHDLPGLADADVVALLATRGVVAGVARDLARAGGGNPLAVLELAGGLSAAQASGREPLPEPLPLGPRGTASFGRRLDGLPARTLSALAAVAAGGDPDLPDLPRVLAALGLDLGDLAPAERAGVLAVAPGVCFRHPLLRSAAATAAGPEALRAAHGAWASHGPEEPVRRARHLAAAAVGASEEAAAALERAGDAAAARGGVAAGADLLARAAALTPDPAVRARRRLRAADSWFLAGRHAQAREHLDALLAGGAAGGVGDQALALDATLTLWADGVVEGSSLVPGTLERLAGTAPDLAALVAIQLGTMQWSAGRHHEGTATVDRAAELAVSDPVVRYLLDLTQAAFRLAVADPAPLAAFRARYDPAQWRLRALERFPAHYQVATEVWRSAGDMATAWAEVQTQVAWARRHAAHALLPVPLMVRAQLRLADGDVLRTRADLVEALQLAEDVGFGGLTGFAHAFRARAAALEGDEETVRRHADLALEVARTTGQRPVSFYVRHALGLLELGCGRPVEAARHLDGNVAPWREITPLHPAVVPWQGDHVEALVAAGRVPDAAAALELFHEDAARSGSPWARAVVLRCAALVAGPDPGDLFEQALAAQADMPFERARTLLRLGEHLRRTRRVTRAREVLAETVELFAERGLGPWLRRAEAEHRAAGGRPASRVRPVAGLTDRELQICLAVADGATNKEAGAKLFLSPKTVEYHLGHAFRKLGVNHRAQLAALVGQGLLDDPR